MTAPGKSSAQRPSSLALAVQSVLICLPLVLLSPTLATFFQSNLFPLPPQQMARQGWWVGVLVGMVGAAALRWRAQGIAFLGYACIFGAALSRAGISNHPDLVPSDGMVNHAVMEMVGLAWVALLLLVSRRDASLPAVCRMLVGAYAVAHLGIALAQLLAVQVVGVEYMRRSILFPHPIFVRDGDVVHTAALRISGLFRNPNSLGAAVMLAWPAAFVWHRGSKKRYLLMALLLPVAAGLITASTYSRAAYAGVALQALVLVVVGVMAGWKTRGRLLLLGAALLLVGFGLGMARPQASDRLLSVAHTSEASIDNRLRVYGDAVKILMERPLEGHGVGAFDGIYNRYWKPAELTYSYGDVHSSVLNGFMETGLLGALLFALAIFGLRPWRLLWGGGGDGGGEGRLPVWIGLGLVGGAVPLTTDNFSVLPGVFVPLMAILAAAAFVAARGEEVAEEERRGGRGAWQRFAPLMPAVLAVVWFGLEARKPMTAEERIRGSLQASVAPLIGQEKVGWFVRDEVRAITNGHNEDQPFDDSGFRRLKVAYCMQQAWAQGLMKQDDVVALGDDGRTTRTMAQALTDMLGGADDAATAAMAMGALEQRLGADEVAACYANFVKRQGKQAHDRGSITPRMALALMEALLAEEREGMISVSGQALRDQKLRGPLRRSDEEDWTIGYRLDASPGAAGQGSVRAFGDERTRWGAALLRKGKSLASGSDNFTTAFFVRCDRALKVKCYR